MSRNTFTLIKLFAPPNDTPYQSPRPVSVNYYVHFKCATTITRNN